MNESRTQPISDADNLDVVGVREDGGIDLVITCSGPLDDSNETVELLGQKVRNYAQLASPAADDFRQEEPHDDHHHYRL